MYTSNVIKVVVYSNYFFILVIWLKIYENDFSSSTSVVVIVSVRRFSSRNDDFITKVKVDIEVDDDDLVSNDEDFDYFNIVNVFMKIVRVLNIY